MGVVDLDDLLEQGRKEVAQGGELDTLMTAGREEVALLEVLDLHERGFFGKVNESLVRGSLDVQPDIAAFQARFEYDGTPAEADAAFEKARRLRGLLRRREQLDPVEGNFLSQLVYSGARILPPMVMALLSAKEEVVQGTVLGAGIGLAGGPAAPLTASAGAALGASAGLTAGSATYWYKQGTGSMLLDMAEEGVDPGKAKLIAGIAGSLYAAIEFSQVSRLTPGMRQGAQKVAQGTISRIVGAALKKYGKTITHEVLEEIGQEAVQIAAVDVANYWGGQGLSFDKQYFIDRTTRLARTAIASTQAMALLPLPGAVQDVTTLARAESASRRDIAKVLGLKPTQLVGKLATQEGRAEALAQAKAQVEEGARRDAEEAGAGVEAPGPPERVPGEAVQPVRVRDVAEDRVEAPPGAEEGEVLAPPVQPGPPASATFEEWLEGPGGPAVWSEDQIWGGGSVGPVTVESATVPGPWPSEKEAKVWAFYRGLKGVSYKLGKPDASGNVPVLAIQINPPGQYAREQARLGVRGWYERWKQGLPAPTTEGRAEVEAAAPTPPAKPVEAVPTEPLPVVGDRARSGTVEGVIVDEAGDRWTIRTDDGTDIIVPKRTTELIAQAEAEAAPEAPPPVPQTPLQKMRALQAEAKQRGEERVPEEAAPAPEPEAIRPAQRLADRLVRDLEEGVSFNNRAFFERADEAYGGTRAQGQYQSSEAYDALEVAVNRYIIQHPEIVNPQASAEEAKTIVDWLDALIDRLPTQAIRSGEKDLFQQFSTPPHYAYVAAWAAKLNQNDVVLEPSAGTGNLVAAALTGAPAQVIANEISSARADLLRQLPNVDTIMQKDAEQIHNTLAGQIAPTVVLMNPPFSHAAHRMGGKTIRGMDRKHVEAALKLLEPNGRLVAIMGAPLIGEQAPVFDRWLAEIGKQYTVRANKLLARSVYRKYGTTFPTRLLVIDNVDPGTQGVPQTERVDNLKTLVDTLEGVRDARIAPEPAAPQPALPAPPAETEGPGGPGVPVQPPSRPVGPGEPGVPRPVGAEPGRPGRPGAEHVRVEPGERAEAAPERPGERQPGEPERGERPGRGGAEVAGEPVREPVPSEPGVETGRQPEVKAVEAETVRAKELTDNLYEPYKPARITIPGAQPHPGSIVESAAMRSVVPPKPTYKPNLPMELIVQGILSDIQLEIPIYAGMCHAKMLEAVGDEVERRMGFMLGDGTGVGKGRELAAIILDNWRQGRRKAVWLSESNALREDAERDWGALLQNPDDIFGLPAAVDTDLQQSQGILFLTYHGLRAKAKRFATKEAPSRLDQIVRWLGEDFDGVIVFDEAHNMGNALELKAKRGKKKAAQMALAGVELQRRLPMARVVYSSATVATELTNYAYATRLGLYGKGTEFSSILDFITKIAEGGLANLEVVARDLKATGRYMARNLALSDGTVEGTVVTDRVIYELDDHDVNVYNKLAEAWQVVLRNINAALGLTGQENSGRAKGSALGRFWNVHQLFFNQVLTALQTPTIIKEMESDLKAGRSCVVQLVNTFEAAQERALAALKDQEDLEEFDLTPRDLLMQYVENSFPTAQYVEEMDDQGNARWVVATENGQVVQNQEAVAARERLLDELASISVPQSPLDMILDHFGVENVAEVTGRKERVVRELQEDGSRKRVRQRRKGDWKVLDANRFMDLDVRVLIFSGAGATGRSYHSDRTAKNQQKRSHYVLQPGWRADKIVQGLGRSHRSNQAWAPFFRLATTNLPGQRRFISSAARRLDQLGALTKGQRKAGSTGLFSAADNLESTEAKEAMRQFFKDLYLGEVEGLTLEEFEEETGLGLTTPEGALKQTLPEITRFLNRILSLKVARQFEVFGLFEQRLTEKVEQARALGTLDVGVETYRAAKISKVEEQTVHVDPDSEAETKYVKLRVSQKTKVTTWEEMQGGAGLAGRTPEFYVRSLRAGGRIYAVASDKVPERTDAKTKKRVAQYRLAHAGGHRFIDRSTIDDDWQHDRWEAVEEETAKQEWQQQAAALPEFTTKEEHLITGVILPIWNRLRGKARVYRMLTDDGEVLLGRVISPRALNVTLRALNAETYADKVKPAALMAQLVRGEVSVTLANKWALRATQVEGQRRIELIGPDFVAERELTGDGVFKERIQYRMRYFIPTTREGVEVFKRVTKNRPVMEVDNLASDADGAGPVHDATLDSVVADIMGEADQAAGEIKDMASGMPSWVRQRERADEMPDTLKAPSAIVEDRLRAAHGMKPPGFLARRIKGLRSLWHAMTRAQGEVPNDAFHADANEYFRLFKAGPEVVIDQATRLIAALTDALGPHQFALYERAVLARNLEASVQRGEPLRFGFASVAVVSQYRQKLDLLAERTPAVNAALAAREKVMQALKSDLIKYKILTPTQAKHWATYFRQQVLSKMETSRAPVGRSWRQRKPGFARRRVKGEVLGEKYDYNTSYIEAETEFFTQALFEIRKEMFVRMMAKRYDMKPRLTEQARKFNEANPDRPPRTWKSFVPEGYGIWQPKPGNTFYHAFSISEQLAEKLHQETVESIEITEEDLREVLAMGRRLRQLVLPVTIVKQLNTMHKRHVGGFEALAKELMRDWKVWTLLFPKRAAQYMTRNLTGDVDGQWAGAPGVLKFVGRATRELWNYYYKKLGMSPALQSARDLGVLGSTLTAQDIPDLKNLALFRRFYAARKARNFNLVEKYFDVVKRFNEFRESVLRYAAYLYYTDEVAEDRPIHYGAAKRSVVDAISNPKHKAAHLARNLLGDYGNLTVMGNWLRMNLMPFYSWIEINTKRYPRLITNALEQQDWKAGGRTALSASAKTAFALLRIGSLYAALKAFNRLAHPIAEQMLGPYDRANPHLILCSSSEDNDQIYVFRNVGALGDFLEWFGVNEALSLLPQYQEGQITAGDIAIQMAKAPVNKLTQALRPEVDVFLGLISGNSTFPDAFNMRTIRRASAIAAAWGLQDEFQGVRKLMGRGGSIRPGYWKRYLTGVVDPRANALHDMYDLREKFLKKEGKEVPPFRGISPFADMRYAAINDDYEAFLDAREIYKKKNKGLKNFEASLANLDPIASRLNDEMEQRFEHEFLNGLQRQKLAITRQYAVDLQDKLRRWWSDAQKHVINEEMRELLRTKAYALSDAEPRFAEPRVKYDERVRTQTEQHAKAMAFLRSYRVKRPDILAAFDEVAGERLKTRAVRDERRRRLMRRLQALSAQ